MALDTESFELLLATVQRFILVRLIPAENHLEEHDEVPLEIVQDMKDMGLFGLTVPDEFGGIGLSVSQEILVNYELGRTAPAFRSVFGTNIGIGSQGILMDGTPEQKAEYLPRVASGELIMSFALTEPDVGSDAASLKTKAELDGDHYILNGTKRYITNSPFANVALIMARTSKEALPKNAHVSAIHVHMDTPGITVGKSDKKMGQAGSHIADIIMADVKLPADALLGGEEGKGFVTAMQSLDNGRLSVGAAAAGYARRALDSALRYANERKAFGEPIANFQLIQQMLAESEIEIYAAECMLEDAARRADAGENVLRKAAAAKVFATEMCGRVVDRVVQIYGGAGYLAEYDAERFFRDARIYRIYEGTTQILQLQIAKHMLREWAAQA
jgi:acyl-CoA dehydrogenase